MKMSDNKQALQVAALKNGTVIDHIPSDKLFTVVALLGLQDSDSNITIGNNFESKKLGKKGIIKVADRFFTDEEISRLSVVAPNVKLNIIRDYEVVEKKQVLMPEELRGIVKCAVDGQVQSFGRSPEHSWFGTIYRRGSRPFYQFGYQL